MLVKGRNMMLRTVQESDLAVLYPYHTDIEGRGPYFPLYIPSESEFRRSYQESGFWSSQEGDVLICDLDGRLLGVILYFKGAPYLTGYEIGYRLFDPAANSGRGIITEALLLMTYILFALYPINRLELKIVPENKLPGGWRRNAATSTKAPCAAPRLYAAATQTLRSGRSCAAKPLPAWKRPCGAFPARRRVFRNKKRRSSL